MLKVGLKVAIRWMVRRDLQEVLAIEQLSFSPPWSEEDFTNALKQRNVVGMVAEHNNRIVGFMIYSLYSKRIQLDSIAVHPTFRRRLVAEQLVNKLQAKLDGKREKINVAVREANLTAQLFFRNAGFIATQVVRGFYEDTTEDAYFMECRRECN